MDDFSPRIFLTPSRRYFVGTANAASYSVSIRKYRYCYAAAATRRGCGHHHERYVHGAPYRGEGGSRGGNVQRVRANSGLHRHANQNVPVLEPAARVPHLGRAGPAAVETFVVIVITCAHRSHHRFTYSRTYSVLTPSVNVILFTFIIHFMLRFLHHCIRYVINFFVTLFISLRSPYFIHFLLSI